MRYIALTALTAVVFALTLGAAPPEAAAGVCKKLGFSNKCVGRKDIRKNAINAARVANASLTGLDLKNEAGADFVAGPTVFNPTGAHDKISSIQVSAPTAGTVIVNASGIIGPGTNTLTECDITTANVTGSGAEVFVWTSFSTLDLLAVPFAATRGFQVGAGTTTFNLICWEVSAAGLVGNVQMTAMYFATRY